MLDERSKQFLEAAKKGIGLLDAGVDFEKLKKQLAQEKVPCDPVGTLNVPGSAGEVVQLLPINIFKFVRKDGKTTWIALWTHNLKLLGIETGHRPIYTSEPQHRLPTIRPKSFLFDHMPTYKDLETAEMVQEIEQELESGVSPTYRCRECGRDTHWLGREETPMAKRWDGLKEKYCGCQDEKKGDVPYDRVTG